MGSRLKHLGQRRRAVLALALALMSMAASAPSIASASELEVRGSRANLDVAKLEGLVRLELPERGATARVTRQARPLAIERRWKRSSVPLRRPSSRRPPSAIRATPP